MEKEKKFMDLIKDSLEKPDIVNEFLTELDKATSGADLDEWFAGKGYSLEKHELNKIFDMKKDISKFIETKGHQVMY